ncbi:MAG: serine/threonine-protein kinase, partial [Planctomycetota bacterium]
MNLELVSPPEGAPSREELERRLAGYRDFRCIGSGAMGVVYDAYHEPLDRNVAVKVLTTGLAGRAITVKRFYQEARAMAQISHPNIVPVYEVGSEEGFPYFTMELVRGGSLKHLLEREGPLPVRRAAEIALDVAEALLHAHRAELLHRDVKPGNVLLDENGTSRLTDFGLVRRTDSVTITASDALVGTPQYMSPEQVRGLKLDGRSDQFSLGTTLYEMLAGTPPFLGENPMSVLRAITELEPRSLASFRPDVPTALQAIVMRMMEKDRDRRYLDMEAVRADLARFLRGEAVEATLPSPVSRAWRRLRSNRLAWRFAVATLL